MSDPKTVLIVEDEKNIVDILRFNLQRAGYQTLEAYDGEDGLAQAVSANPDLILLDVMLPKKNGFDVCRALRDQLQNVLFAVEIREGVIMVGLLEVDRVQYLDLILISLK